MVTLDIIDTAGQEKWQSLTKTCFRNCTFVLLCFDPSHIQQSDRDSILNSFITLVLDTSSHAQIVLVVTKIDLATPNEIQEIERYCTEFSDKNESVASHFITSAITGHGIDDLFNWLGNQNVFESVRNENHLTPLPKGTKTSCCQT
jgi:GTPase SAR1 family protein